MLGGLVFSGKLLRLIQTPDNIFSDSLLYLEIYVWSLPFVFFYNVANGIFSALGDSKTPFIFLAASSTANVGMDILFVAAFGMGIAGVAWATFLCQGVSCVLALAVVFRRLVRISTEEKPRIFSVKLLKDISAVAVPSIIQQGCISAGNIIIQSVVNSFGSGVIAGYSAAVKLNNLVITSLTTLGNGVSNYTAQNIGAGKTDRVRSGLRAALKLVWALSVPIAVLYFFAGEPLVKLFMDEPSDIALETGISFLRTVAPFYVVVAAKLASDGVLRGASLMGRFMAATFTDLVLRVVLAIIFANTLGSSGIWFSWIIGWTTATVMSLLFYAKEFRGRAAK